MAISTMTPRIVLRLLPRTRRQLVVTTAVLVAVAAIGAAAVYYYHTEAVLHDAEQALERHDNDAARQLLARYLQARPNAGRGHFLAARAARRVQRYDEAEEHLLACQRLGYDPDAISLERTMSDVQRGNLRAEKPLWARVEADDPQALAILEVLIQEYIDSYRLGRALDALKLYLDKRPNDVQAMLGRAYVFERLLYFGQATDDYRRAVAVAPDNDAARQRFAESLLIVGPPSEALRQFETLRGRCGDTPAVVLGLAKSRRQLGQTEKAKQLLNALLKDQPQNAAALVERGKVALEQEQFEEAESFLRRGVELAPHDREAHHNLSVALRQEGRGEEAAKEIARVQEIDADLRRLDRVTKAVLKSPGDVALRCEAALLFLHNGEEQEGVRWLTFALRLDAGCVPAHKALADYYRKTGQTELADRHERLAQLAGDGTHAPPQ
jgi:tetratricopeptide (TPR) repeat protein